MKKRELELLSPAKNIEIARAAIQHGADAVYIGGPDFGARKSASNDIEDIRQLVDYAHKFRVKVYITLNTIIYENELKRVEKLIKEFYHIGVDALIVQDMGILRMDIPPIALHASTQCDIRSVEKARFLEEVGFSQIVLARELPLSKIKEIAQSVTIPVEVFVHGALCVSYSGRCHASFAMNGRSANRGECAQICRLPFNLVNEDGKKIIEKKYLLSLKDLNRSESMNELIKAGVSSFKIEGRLKDIDYVKNITSLYRNKINEIIEKEPELYKRSSAGQEEIRIVPIAEKSFNRGFTKHYLYDRPYEEKPAWDTPKSKGEPINDITLLNNGDGISFFDKKGEYSGMIVNKVSGNKIFSKDKTIEFKKGKIFRTFDKEFQKKIIKDCATRKIDIAITLENSGVLITDDRDNLVKTLWEVKREEQKKFNDYREEFSKFGNTIYNVTKYENLLTGKTFIPHSDISKMRKILSVKLDRANKINYPLVLRSKENLLFPYPSKKITFGDNVSNSYALLFYKDHGVEDFESAMEIAPKNKSERVLMTTKHCILRSLGKCKKRCDAKSNKEFAPQLLRNLKEPLYLESGNHRFRLQFNCKECEMQVIGK